MKNKIPVTVIITDTHLDEDNFDRVYSVHVQTIELCKELGLKFVIHAGDHFTNRTSQKLTTLLNFKKIIKLYEQNKIYLYTISGNHDKTNQEVSDSYVDVYDNQYLKNFDLQNFQSEDTHGIVFYFLSYYEENVFKSKLNSLTEFLNVNKKNVLITHYGIDGVINNDERKVESEIKENSFHKFNKVFIGHYHNSSKVSERVHYIGSTDARNFGENNNKGATILYNDLSFEKFQFNFKGYEKVVVEEFDFKDTDEIIQKYKSEDTNVRIEFKGTREQLIRVDKKKLRENGIEFILVDETLVDTEVPQNGNEVKSIKMEKKDVLKYLDEYAKQNSISRTKLAKIITKF